MQCTVRRPAISYSIDVYPNEHFRTRSLHMCDMLLRCLPQRPPFPYDIIGQANNRFVSALWKVPLKHCQNCIVLACHGLHFTKYIIATKQTLVTVSGWLYSLQRRDSISLCRRQKPIM